MSGKILLPPPGHSGRLLARMDPPHVAMFRFLLETHENMAFFTVLERRPALLKIVFSPDCRDMVLEILTDMQKAIPFEILEWPARKNI